jgi:glutaredoxin
MSAEVVTFTDPNCGHCRRLKDHLSRRGVRFENRDVTTDPSAAEELQRMAAPGVPVTRIGTETIVGYDPDRIDDALQAQGVTTTPA